MNEDSEEGQQLFKWKILGVTEKAGQQRLIADEASSCPPAVSADVMDGCMDSNASRVVFKLAKSIVRMADEASRHMAQSADVIDYPIGGKHEYVVEEQGLFKRKIPGLTEEARQQRLLADEPSSCPPAVSADVIDDCLKAIASWVGFKST